MSGLISNVLDLMRFEAGEVHLRRDWQTIDDLLGLALGQLHEALRHHVLRIDLPVALPAVYVDALLVTQVFSNLLDNCVKHTPAGTQISVSASVEGPAVRVVVDDNGPSDCRLVTRRGCSRNSSAAATRATPVGRGWVLRSAAPSSAPTVA